MLQCLLLNLPWKALEKGPTSSKYKAALQMSFALVYGTHKANQHSLTKNGRDALGEKWLFVAKW
jgi:hypothetical protein